jgi:Protein of unknown function (DUF429)
MQAPVLGVDFTSSPSRKKPVLVAQGELHVQEGGFTLQALHRFQTHQEFLGYLQAMPAWVAGFDMPFALPREFLQTLNWPHASWREHIAHLHSLSRTELVSACRAFCAARPAGQKFAHRACDFLAGSSPSMKWVNPPVAQMLHAGAPLLLACEATLPGQHCGRAERIALEAYPGFAARQVLGRQSYKSDDVRKQTPDRRAAREHLLEALIAPDTPPPGLPQLLLPKDLHAMLLDDASGDCLDATICALQAAWGALRAAQDYGLPSKRDRLEGWIVSVGTT